MRAAVEVFLVALRLGLTSFGGPAAHIGYFRAEYVERRGWLTDEAFAELVAVAQFLPGPSSSQLGAAVGHTRAGWAGAAAAWLGFTLPSAVAMALFAALATAGGGVADAVWLHALMLVAVAVVLDAVLSMARTLTRTPLTIGIATGCAAALLLLPAAGFAQPGVLLLAALVGLLLARGAPAAAVVDPGPRIGRRTGAALLAAFGVLFAVALPVGAAADAGPLAELTAAMFGAGSLVFGGGHVVLPLLETATVPHLVDQGTFVAGYGAAQAVPGPLFTFGSYLGQAAAGVPGAVLATVAIFLPGMLLMFGVLPFWAAVRSRPPVRAALVGVNAGVVGLLAAALVDPILTETVRGPVDAAVAVGLFVLLRVVHLRPVLVVLVALLGSPLLLFG